MESKAHFFIVFNKKYNYEYDGSLVTRSLQQFFSYSNCIN